MVWALCLSLLVENAHCTSKQVTHCFRLFLGFTFMCSIYELPFILDVELPENHGHSHLSHLTANETGLWECRWDQLASSAWSALHCLRKVPFSDLCHPMLHSDTHRWAGAAKSKAAFLGLRVAPSCAVAVASGLPPPSPPSFLRLPGAPVYNPWLAWVSIENCLYPTTAHVRQIPKSSYRGA